MIMKSNGTMRTTVKQCGRVPSQAVCHTLYTLLVYIYVLYVVYHAMWTQYVYHSFQVGPRAAQQLLRLHCGN